ncbi:TPM domain-containing protein [uncultured Erythrobacter sp.]|uniref:TPM domain-containing protein n=1 Tax=uncultured Erythrobacter sp. TaxID=263913 RepID=UPI00261A7F54|nr:TPM domain-containing protein [uncultured Erythrobacter sp.]
MFRPFLLTFAALLIVGCAAEAEEVELPPPTPALELTGRVVDAADLFDAQYEDGLTRKLGQLEQDTQVQLVVATTPDLKGQTIEQYSLDLANAWGIGSVERDDGLLLLVAPTERRVRIEVGYGLEASVKDEEAAQIIQDDILPHFRKGDFEVGVAEGVDSLIREVTPIELKEAA